MRKGKIPIVFIPGLFGSMSNNIIPGTGNWGFGLAAFVYEPFIMMLESMGYKRNKDLFICFYDWQQRIVFSTQKYLLQTIAYAKKITGCDKLNLICHSMGGLLGRTYVQSDEYKNDVNQLIILCTPNAGSPANYSYWTEGSLPVHASSKINIVHFYMEQYIHYLGTLHNMNTVEAIHLYFPGLQDVIPCKDYGNYLFTRFGSSITFLPYSRMNTKKPFLDALNENRFMIQKRNIETILITEDGEETIQYLQVVPSYSKLKWTDGKVVGDILTKHGDGNAVLHSVFLLEGNKYVVHASHNEVLYKSIPILQKIL
ncbi:MULTISPECIES: esterase/lipase family protein [Bacillus cereus group]|uniref:esterase/lipase family protein n=1 Tax=Bacillus cereus group TaxID=86661 RepID=UPI0008FE270B|nr:MULTISPECIES: alpha/beta fold hydrolase [Bacillus cereus group]MDG1621453.1 alpha/beta fold hydrolase [Bacillus mobilis]MDX5837760.1 alpha/beta fold hydrolase [Bacillus cereus group sp. BfR-BA-01700]MED4386597.1 alpha/beta fold hydrolase [Bacillus mobilis]OJE42641.1 acetyltransferase [Bacillus mobilis]HDR7242701.1 alpha/beta fold hydrolase [Bacillus mobilis]